MGKVTEKILSDQQFLRIRKLNSRENTEHRRSITSPELNILAAAEGLPDKESTPEIVSYDIIQENREVATPVSISSKSQDERTGDRSTVVTSTADILSRLNPEDEKLFSKHAKYIRSRFKLRYRNDNIVSYFDDVDFDFRPSILDGSINEPYRLSFEGPTLEREIRLREKAKRSAKRSAFKQGQFEKLDLGDEPEADNDSSTYDETSVISNGKNETWQDESSILPPGAVSQRLISNFSGIYVALWMGLAWGVLRVVVDVYVDANGTLRDWEIIHIMTDRLFTVALVDLGMYLAGYLVFLIHYLCKKGIIRWNKSGWIIVSLYEMVFVFISIYLPYDVLHLPWIARIYLFLHSVVLLMKMHSFAFFNGYLWSIYEELMYSKNALNNLKDLSPAKDSTEKKTREEIEDILRRSYNFCKFELTAQSLHDPSQKFPNNINIKNYFMFTMFPVIVYQIEYPRTTRVRWSYVVEKLAAIFGTIFIMIVDAQMFMYPVLMRSAELGAAPRTSSTLAYSLLIAKQLIDIIPSFIVMYLLVFYLIWDAILNCIAELTRFGDRYFYGDWWNCVTWDEFSRIWNIPVHKFLLRHVYHASISSLGLGKYQATLMTFFLSAIFHEMSMYVIFRRFRLYLFCFQLLQLPLVSLSNTKLMKKKTILGNVIFWLGICMGPSVILTLYLTL